MQKNKLYWIMIISSFISIVKYRNLRYDSYVMEAKKFKIPEEVLAVLRRLEDAGFTAYAVCGCGRGFLI